MSKNPSESVDVVEWFGEPNRDVQNIVVRTVGKVSPRSVLSLDGTDIGSLPGGWPYVVMRIGRDRHGAPNHHLASHHSNHHYAVAAARKGHRTGAGGTWVVLRLRKALRALESRAVT